jgi:ATP-dependent DNA ligase
MRVNQGQELVIAGYTLSAKNFEALVIGFYQDCRLMYAASTRDGYTPASRAGLFKKLKPLEFEECQRIGSLNPLDVTAHLFASMEKLNWKQSTSTYATGWD